MFCLSINQSCEFGVTTNADNLYSDNFLNATMWGFHNHTTHGPLAYDVAMTDMATKGNILAVRPERGMGE